MQRMILTRDAILEEIQQGNLVISDFNEENVGPASVDLTLDDEIRVFTNYESIVPIQEDVDYKKATRLINIRETGYILKPQELILGITKETILLPPYLAGWLQSRSRFARLGLMSHITAPFIMPGSNNKQVLEIFNAGNCNLQLVSGIKICQMIFNRCEGKASYDGKFQHQNLT